MSGLAKGDKLTCKECGMELEVTKSCECTDCDCKVICCSKPMEITAKEGGCCCSCC